MTKSEVKREERNLGYEKWGLWHMHQRVNCYLSWLI